METERDFIGASEAAALLGVVRSSITRWIARGVIKPVARLDGPQGAYIFAKSDVLRLRAQLASEAAERAAKLGA